MVVSRALAFEHAPILRRLVLGVDPGEECGASLIVVDDAGVTSVRWSREIQTNTIALEYALRDALELARSMRVKLTIAAEEWGRGGPLGLDQWIGLGAHVGAWRRAAALEHAAGWSDAYAKSNGFVRVGMSSWRAALLPGVAAIVKTKKPRDRSDEWKRQASARVLALFPDIDVKRFGPNAAESVLIGVYATRDFVEGERVAIEKKPARKKPERKPKPSQAPATGIRRRKVEVLPLPLPTRKG